MRTTLDIDASLLQQVVDLTGASTKKHAIDIVMREYVRLRQRSELASRIGAWDDFALTAEELKAMREDTDG